VTDNFQLSTLHSQLPKGYKQTEVGVIPEDWDTKSVRELAQIKTGPFGTLLKASEYSDKEGVPLISVGEIGAGRFKVTEHTPLAPITVVRRLPQYVLRTGDVVFGRKGAVERSALVTENENGWFLGSDGIAIRPREGCYPPYLAAQFQGHDVQSWLIQNAVGTTMASLNQAVLGRVQIPVAPLPEQRAIAAALSDVDALLAKLDQLIAKKRDLKQATMQQLLTGQTRLVESGEWIVESGENSQLSTFNSQLKRFSGAWEVKTLGSVFEITAGKSKSAYVTDGGDFVICDMGSVSTDGRLITSKRTNYRGDFLVKGDLVMPKDDIGGGKIIGRVGYVDCPNKYVLGDHVYRLHALEGDPLFFSYLINAHSINSALRKKVIGSAQLGLGRRSVEEQEISFPSPTEQAAIAAVLSDMDAEIAALEARRDKTRALKQGMMQELLTGRIRLVESGELKVESSISGKLRGES